jgi:hypothetical protein
MVKNNGGRAALTLLAVVTSLLAVTSPAATSAAATRPLTWAIVPSPSPAKNTNELSAVSCHSARFCVAAGDTIGAAKGSAGSPLTESWNGTAWSVSPAPKAPGGELSGVSCPSATACVAVGFTSPRKGINNRTLAERSSWSQVPVPRKGISAGLSGVSCASAATCTAVGDFFPNSVVDRTLVETGTAGT